MNLRIRPFLVKRKAFEKANNPIACLAIAALLASLFVVTKLALNDWDPSRFVYAGDTFTDPDRSPSSLYVYKNDTGYDGQFFYRLAIDPFTRDRTDYGITFDSASYRHQRIVYPLLAWFLSLGGNISLVPLTLILINIMGMAAIGYVGGSLAKGTGRHAMWGLAFAGYPGFVVSLSRNLAEIVTIALLLGAILALRTRHFGAATLLLCLAALSRETAIAFCLFSLAAWLFKRVRGSEPSWIHVLVNSFPVLVLAAWQFFLRTRWGEAPIESGSGLLGLPFRGVVSTALTWVVPGSMFETLGKAGWIILVLGFILVVSRSLLRSRASTAEKFSAVGYFTLATMLSWNVWIVMSGFIRAFSEAYALGTLVLMNDERAPSKGFLPVVAVTWVAHAVQRLF